MGRLVAVSFEGETIKVLYASVKGRDVVVNDAVVLKDDQFDDFLLKEKTKEFIVVNSFMDFYQDTVSVPPAKGKHIKVLAEAEVRKKAPFKDFSFIHVILGERVVENRTLKDVYIFAVRTEDITRITSRFARHGKVIKALYPDIFAITSYIGCDDVTFLCISEVGLNKNEFVVKNGAVCFARSAQSFEPGLSEADLQNTSMTVNYCRQTLRITPSFILLAGTLCDSDNVSVSILPAACLVSRTGSLSLDAGTLARDFISPVSALFVRDGGIDILTRDYRIFSLTNKLLGYATVIFLGLSIIGAGYGAYKVKNIIELKEKLNSIRKNLTDIDTILSEHDRRQSEFAGYQPYIKSISSAASIPDIRNFLSLFSEVRMTNIRLDSVTLSTTENMLTAALKGSVKSSDYVDIQRNYQDFIRSVGGVKGVAVKGEGLVLTTKGFHVEFDWIPQKNVEPPGQKGR